MRKAIRGFCLSSVLAAGLCGVVPAAQASIPGVTVKELVAGPMAQGRGNLAETTLFTFPGNVREPERALEDYHDRAHLNAVTMTPAGQASYRKVIQALGIRQWLSQGGSVALKVNGPAVVTGSDNRPILSYPVTLIESRGAIHKALPYTLALTYVDYRMQPGLSAVPTIAQVAMTPR
jgi:hypothetical protein